MAKDQMTPIDRWTSELESLGKKLQMHAKAIVAAGEDPFALREHLDRAEKTVRDINVEQLRVPVDARKSVETRCVEGTAEFWQKLCLAAKEFGWEVHGSTDRRLIARALFVDLKNDAVTIDGVPAKLTPHVPAVVAALKPVIESLATPKDKLQEFANTLAEAYDAAGGAGEIAVEAVFRQCILLMQPAQFWATIEPARFQSLPRPLFRFRISAILAENLRSAKGREMRLTPTVNRKDIWEVFSPAEGRVVQVGRIAFVER